MVWAEIHYDGRTALVRVNGALNAQIYWNEILQSSSKEPFATNTTTMFLALQNEWQNIPQCTIQIIVASMRRRTAVHFDTVWSIHIIWQTPTSTRIAKFYH